MSLGSLIGAVIGGLLVGVIPKDRARHYLECFGMADFSPSGREQSGQTPNLTKMLSRLQHKIRALSKFQFP